MKLYERSNVSLTWGMDDQIRQNSFTDELRYFFFRLTYDYPVALVLSWFNNITKKEVYISGED